VRDERNLSTSTIRRSEGELSKLSNQLAADGCTLIGLLPIGELIYKWLADQLTVNPIGLLEQFLDAQL
jgi:hypothetical protein